MAEQKFCVDCEFHTNGFPISPTPHLCTHPKVTQIDTVSKDVRYVDCRLMRMEGQECGTFGNLFQEKQKKEDRPLGLLKSLKSLFSFKEV